MIKCDGFGKLLKPLFSILLIGFFGLFVGSSVSAYSCNYSVANYFCNDYLNFGQSDNSNLYFGGSVKDNKFNFYGGANYVFRFDIPLNGVSFNALNYWWQSDGLHYSSRFSEGDSEYNGKIDGFYVCNNRPGNSYAHLSQKDGCVYHDGFDDFSQYISNSSTYVFACNRGYPNNIQSKDVNCVVCVCNGNCGYGKQHICIDKSKTSNNSSTFITQAEISLSLGKNNPEYYYPVEDNTNSTLTGNYVYSTCTYGELINYMESVGMSKYLCYGGLDNFDLYNSETTYNPLPGSGKTLTEILNYSSAWDNSSQWYNYWNGIRGGYTEIWESYPAVYKTWFDIYYQYGGDLFDFESVRLYCSWRNNESVYNTEYKGEYLQPLCKYIRMNPNVSSSGQVGLGVSWDGVGNMGGEVITNPKIAIQSFFDKLKANMNTSYFGLGAIPQYIIFFLMALILFRFLAH